MAHGIRWSPGAVSGFEAICNHIARDSPFYAGLFAKKIDAIVTGLAQFPRAGRVVPEYGDEAMRERIYQNYRIVYRLKSDTIEIVAITHGARPLRESE